jgi:hypothetical protein
LAEHLVSNLVGKKAVHLELPMVALMADELVDLKVERKEFLQAASRVDVSVEMMVEPMVEKKVVSMVEKLVA